MRGDRAPEAHAERAHELLVRDADGQAPCHPTEAAVATAHALTALALLAVDEAKIGGALDGLRRRP